MNQDLLASLEYIEKEKGIQKEVLLEALKQALALVDVRVLDHFVVGGSAVLSFAERGLI